ncbi:MAG: hypothetical protein M3134_06675 [Actinomycetota bacterium]|nr:hypothetical protein [Actinomycetota bacterium]
MRDERTPPAGEEPPAQDILEHGLLHEVLGRHPAQLTFDELVRMLGEERFLVEDAVAALVGDGLLHRHGDFIVASRAAVRFDELSR